MIKLSIATHCQDKRHAKKKCRKIDGRVNEWFGILMIMYLCVPERRLASTGSLQHICDS